MGCSAFVGEEVSWTRFKSTVESLLRTWPATLKGCDVATSWLQIYDFACLVSASALLAAPTHGALGLVRLCGDKSLLDAPESILAHEYRRESHGPESPSRDGHILTDPNCFTNPTGQNQHIVTSIWIPIRVTVNSSGEKESASPCSETPTGQYFLG